MVSPLTDVAPAVVFFTEAIESNRKTIHAVKSPVLFARPTPLALRLEVACVRVWVRRDRNLPVEDFLHFGSSNLHAAAEPCNNSFSRAN